MSLLRKKTFFSQLRNFSSALYITGDKAQKNFALLTPVIDFEEQLLKRDEIVDNIKARKINIDFKNVEKRWEFFKFVDNRKEVLEHTRAELARVISELMKDAEQNAKDIEKFKLHLNVVKNDLKNVKDSYYGIEEGTMLQVLSLPNILHERTPKDSEEIIYEHLDKPKGTCKNHTEIGRKLMKYINPMCCFLKSEAALFELAIQEYFKNFLLNQQYTQLSNSDFTRSIVVEGCGTNFRDADQIFTLENPHEKSEELRRLHLTGAASLYSFMAFFTRHFVQQTQLPLRYFSIGRKYVPQIDENANGDLFSLCQYSALHLFVASSEEQDMIDDIIKELVAIYSELGYHFRLVLLPAKDLNRAESLRISIQMFSNSLNAYVEVGNVSCYESYLSKRLLFSYAVNKERKYHNVTSGNILNVHKMLGCILENDFVQNKEPLLSLLKQINPS